MTLNEIVNELRSIRYGRPPTLADIARDAGISRVTVYRVITEGTASTATAEALGKVLHGVRNGRVPQTPSTAPRKPIAGHPTR